MDSTLDSERSELAASPGICWNGGVCILHSATNENFMAHSCQRLYDVKMEPQTLALQTFDSWQDQPGSSPKDSPW